MIGTGINMWGQIPSVVARSINSIPDTVSGQLISPTDPANFFQMVFNIPAGDGVPVISQVVIQPVSTPPTLELWVGTGGTGAGRTRVTLNMATGEFSRAFNLDDIPNFTYGMVNIGNGASLVWFSSATLIDADTVEVIRLSNVSHDIKAGAFMVSEADAPQVFEETTGTPGLRNLIDNSDGSDASLNNVTASAATITVR